MSEHFQQPAASRLLQLSEEVNRIANSLVQLSTGAASAPPERISDTATEIPIDVASISAVIRLRHERARYLPEDLLAEPVWDMLLDLLRAEVMQQRVSVSSVCLAAGVPATTALRWLKIMEDRGLVTRQPDRFDGRRVFVALAPHVSSSLRQWFADRSRAA